MARHHLHCVAHGAGSIEWRVQAPLFTPQIFGAALAVGTVLVAVPAALLGAGWQTALLLGLGTAAVLVVLHCTMAVSQESLTYIRLLGVRLASRRRCGRWESSRFLPLRQLQGIIIHEEVSPSSVHFYIGLPLKADSSSGSGGKADGSANDGSSGGSANEHGGSTANGSSAKRSMAAPGEVVVAFPSLRPRLSLLRQVYQQLQPLLDADLESRQNEAETMAEQR